MTKWRASWNWAFEVLENGALGLFFKNNRPISDILIRSEKDFGDAVEADGFAEFAGWLVAELLGAADVGEGHEPKDAEDVEGVVHPEHVQWSRKPHFPLSGCG
jgi:hypothetical protein